MLAGVGLSFGGLIVRNCEVANEWQIILYRSSAVAIILLLLMVWQGERPIPQTIRQSGWPCLCAGLLIAVSMVTFVLSVNATSVANTLFVLAVSPFLAAVLAWMLLRERVDRVTWIAMTFALLGVGVMVWHGMTSGSLYGNIMALVTALSFAGFTVALRFGHQTEMMPSVFIAGIASATVAATVLFFGGYSFFIPYVEIGLCALWGTLIACCLTVWVFGSRFVPAAVLALLSLTEVLLGPLWVWLFLNEIPHVMTLIGGIVLMAAVVGQAFGRIRLG